MQTMDREPMRSFRTHIKTLVLVAGIVFLVSSAAGSPGIQAALGDKVTISGYSYGSPWVYLFLTGPNLPVNGVALNDITKRADQGGFTIVDVDGNNHWVYNWNTASPGGRLDAGTYTIFVVNGPNDRSRLAEADYSTISVTLGEPSIAVETPTLPGGMDLRSVPDGASLVVNGEYRGKTPMTISDLAAGTYNVTFSRFGFVEVSTPVPGPAGKTIRSECHAPSAYRDTGGRNKSCRSPDQDRRRLMPVFPRSRSPASLPTTIRSPSKKMDTTRSCSRSGLLQDRPFPLRSRWCHFHPCQQHVLQRLSRHRLSLSASFSCSCPLITWVISGEGERELIFIPDIRTPSSTVIYRKHAKNHEAKKHMTATTFEILMVIALGIARRYPPRPGHGICYRKPEESVVVIDPEAKIHQYPACRGMLCHLRSRSGLVFSGCSSIGMSLRPGLF